MKNAYKFTNEQKMFIHEMIYWLERIHKAHGMLSIRIRNSNVTTNADVQSGIKKTIKDLKKMIVSGAYDEWDARILKSLREDYISGKLQTYSEGYLGVAGYRNDDGDDKFKYVR